MAQRHFTPRGEMTQGRKKITEVIKVVQFDNAEMKFCLVASQGAKETEDHFRLFLPKIPVLASGDEPADESSGRLEVVL